MGKGDRKDERRGQGRSGGSPTINLTPKRDDDGGIGKHQPQQRRGGLHKR